MAVAPAARAEASGAAVAQAPSPTSKASLLLRDRLLEKWLCDADGTITPSASLQNSQPIAELLGKRRKKRTSIENTVRVALEKAFVRNPKPTSEEIRIIGDSLNMEKEVVRVWFCNR